MNNGPQQPVDDELIAELKLEAFLRINGGSTWIDYERLAGFIIAYADRRADKRVEEAAIKAEIKGKIEALDKMVMGAGEYHDDPYEYVVRLSDLREYRAKLAQFDPSQPIFRDATHHPKGGSKSTLL